MPQLRVWHNAGARSGPGISSNRMDTALPACDRRRARTRDGLVGGAEGAPTRGWGRVGKMADIRPLVGFLVGAWIVWQVFVVNRR